MKLTRKNKTIIYISLLLILSSFPLFYYTDIIYGHDIQFHLSRISAITENIKIWKIIPVYFSYLDGFGYGNGLFYPDLFLYIPAFFNAIGFGLVSSYKIFILLINLFSILSIYICIKKITNNDKSTQIGTLLYSLSLYRYIDTFERGALGESLAFIFIPLIILGLYKIFYDNPKEGYYLSFGLIGILFSHIIGSYIFILFTIIVILINIKKLKEKEILKSLFINISLSILITSVFWIPLLEQLLTTKFNFFANNELYNNILPLTIVFMDFPAHLYGDIWYPTGLGIIYYIMLIINIKKQKNNKFLKLVKYSIVITLIIITTRFIWEIGLIKNIIGIIQFPWRLYMLLQILFVIFVSIVLKDRPIMLKISIRYVVIVFIVNIILSIYNITIGGIGEYGIMYGEYLPIEINQEELKNYKNDNIEYERKNEKTIIKINNYKENQELPLIYYKGYVAKEKEKIYKVEKSENGLVQIKTDNKAKEITVHYEGTNISKISKLTSIIGILLFIIWRKNEKKNNR